MNKSELVASIAAKSGAKASEVESMLDSLWLTIREELEAGNKVTLNGIGTFEMVKRAARSERVGINLHTKEKMVIAAIPERFAPKFKISKKFVS